MLKNFLKVFARRLLDQKLFSLINIAGLAAGLMCCTFIALFVRHELSYDR